MNFRSGLILVIVLLVAEGLYAVHLNAAFYQQHIPFFDSCSYTNQLAVIFEQSRDSGLKAAFQSALAGNVALPWLESALLAKLFAPSRMVGVWLQWVWLLVLEISLYWYFTKFRDAEPWRAVCLCLPFAFFESALRWNGGLPDFRMDLSAYIFLSLTALWYGIAAETDRLAPWLIAGCFGTLSILARSIAPVYLLAMLGPLMLHQLAIERRARAKLALRMAAMAAMMLPGVAYLIGNFQLLSFYYGSSPDANAHLPLTRSWHHLEYALAHAGAPLGLACIVFFALRVRHGWRGPNHSLDWRLAYLGLAPALLLIFRGAGLNPFVSMPALFGIFLFALFPVRGPGAALPSPSAAYLFLVAACLLNIFTVDFASPFFGASVTRMSGMRTVTNQLIGDASSRGLLNVRYAVPEMGEFHSCALKNALLFDRGGEPVGNAVRLPSGMLLSFPLEAEVAAESAFRWSLVPGNSDRQKLQRVQTDGLNDDYLLLPSDGAIGYLEKTRPQNTINLKIRELKARWLASGRLTQIGNAAQIAPRETIEVFAVH